MIRDGSKLVRTKLALFQCKRLYPVEQPIDEAEVDHYMIGFARLLESDAFAADASAAREFTFKSASTYKMLLAGDEQVKRIEAFERANRTPVHYMLYNPAVIPWTQRHPLTGEVELPTDLSVGCRVLPARLVRKVLAGQTPGDSLCYSDVLRLPSPFRGRATTGGRRIEDFIERILTCREGYLAENRDDGALNTVFIRRGGPIAAAIGVTLSAPSARAVQ